MNKSKIRILLRKNFFSPRVQKPRYITVFISIKAILKHYKNAPESVKLIEYYI